MFVPTAEYIIGGANRYSRKLRNKVSYVLFINEKRVTHFKGRMTWVAKDTKIANGKINKCN